MTLMIDAYEVQALLEEGIHYLLNIMGLRTSSSPFSNSLDATHEPVFDFGKQLND
jgi:hypothetical protein